MKKVLLDENVDHRLAALLPEALEVRSVGGEGLTGVSNGELLQRASAAGFDVLVTTDRNMEHQQNPATLPLPVVVVYCGSSVRDLRPFVPRIVEVLESNLRKGFHKVRMPPP